MARRQTGFWSNLLGLQPARDKFSLEELQHLHDVLRSNATVTEQNRDVVVEALRAVAELIIWGDQNDPRLFEYFLESNLMRHFSQLLESPSNRRGEVAKQVLQTLYILIQNVRSQTAIYYILSNNHVNDVVTLAFDFEDDEVLGYYINLLKTISLRLTPKSVQFFYQVDGERSAFPLYTEAVKFVNHRDGMVRAAVRTLTLNVMRLEDAAVQAFLASAPASNYFHELAIVVAEQCQLHASCDPKAAAIMTRLQLLDRRLSSLEAGTSAAAYAVETQLGDIEDLMSYSNDVLCTGQPALSQLFLGCLWRSFVRPILIEPVQQLAGGTASSGILPLCALCILERLLHLTSHATLANGVAGALLGPKPGPQQQEVPWDESDSCRDGFLAALRGGETVAAAAAVRVVLALVQSQSIDQDLLDSSGLLPQRRKKNKQLLDILTAEDDSAPAVSPQRDLFADQSFSRGSWGAGSKAGPSHDRHGPDPATSRRQNGLAPETDVDLGGRRAWGDLLCTLLSLELLPCTAVWAVGYVLLQLLPPPKSGPAVSGRQAGLLRDAVRTCQSAFVSVAAGAWTDALPMLVLHEWERAARDLASPALPTTQLAVQSYMQAIQAQKLAVEDAQTASGGRSAREAAAAIHVVQRLVALLQIQQALTCATFPARLPIAAASEAQVKRGEAREGMHLDLAAPMPCSVSFSRGAERSVLIAVHGTAQARVQKPSAKASLTREEEAVVASSSPSVLLAHAGANETGVVLSVAPLVGANAHTDAEHKRWLHIHVRPNARGMLKTVRNARMGETMQQLEQHLVDGHWVLAFETPAAAEAAQQRIREQAAATADLLKLVLSPLLL